MQASRVSRAIEYPDSDGQPMADNTLQYQWIVTIQGGLDTELADFVGGDLLWYPVEGHPEIRVAPDALVALGRPKGHRGSYRQWDEEGVAPQVVFEILSPGNRLPEMQKKFRFYQTYGVQEYYLYDPDDNQLFGWQRDGELLQEIRDIDGWVSPLLGIRFELDDETLHIFHKDGSPFWTFAEISERAKQAELLARQAELQAKEAENRAEEAELQARQAELQAKQAEDRAAEAEQKVVQERLRAEALEARLRALGIEI